MTQLKPVSDKARDFLSLLGETPSQHQEQLLRIHDKTLRPKGTPRSKPSEAEVRHKLNEETYKASLVPKQTLAELTANLLESEWTADAYVLYKRKQICRNCQYVCEALDIPKLFLRHRKRSRDSSNAKFYEPVKHLLRSDLPRLVEIVVSSTPVCLQCFERASCEPSSLLSPQAPIESSSLTIEDNSPCLTVTSPLRTLSPFTSSLETAVVVTSEMTLPETSSPELQVSTMTSLDAGSDFVSSSQELPVLVPQDPILTAEASNLPLMENGQPASNMEPTNEPK